MVQTLIQNVLHVSKLIASTLVKMRYIWLIFGLYISFFAIQLLIVSSFSAQCYLLLSHLVASSCDFGLVASRLDYNVWLTVPDIKKQSNMPFSGLETRIISNRISPTRLQTSE